MRQLVDLLAATVEHKGSDLHLKAGAVPAVRVEGRLEPVGDDALAVGELEDLANAVVPASKQDELLRTGDADFALSLPGLGRFRINIHRQRGSLGVVARRVLPGTPSFDRLGLPMNVRDLADHDSGLILVTGSAGSGTTTTAAALLDHINSTRACSILTIEDPVEVLHPDKAAFVMQREVGTDTISFADALGRAWRQDPQVLYVSTLRDPESLAIVLDLADTGHLVITTLPTPGVEESVDRLLELAAPNRHPYVLGVLSRVLRGVVSQRLVVRSDGRGRIPAVELLVSTPRVQERLNAADEPVHLLDIVQDGQLHGMQTFDQSLENLCREGHVAITTALAAASDPVELRMRLRLTGLLRA